MAITKTESGIVSFLPFGISPQTMRPFRPHEPTVTIGSKKIRESVTFEALALDLAHHFLAITRVVFVGVGRSERKGKSGNIEICWQTTYPGPNGKVKNEKFAVGKYGEIGALRLALQARRAGLIAALGNRNLAEDEIAYAVIDFYDDILANLKDYKDQSSEPSIIEIVRNPDVPATTKLEQLQIRIGQQRFRREVLEIFDNKCAITGSSLLIRASHIKPWRVANNEERLNPANGLALSPVYDAAFDLGLITFRPDGQIMLSSKLANDAAALGVTGNERINSLTDEHYAFLDWHRKNIFSLNNG